MSFETYPQRATEPESVRVPIRMLGTGASHPTKVLGQGATITRTAAGVFKVAFGDAPGNFAMPSSPSLQAATPGDMKNCSVVFDTYDSATKSIEVSLFNSAGVARELAANEWISFDLDFKRTTVNG